MLNRETGKKSSIGSGFIVGDGRQLATNYHVISQVILEPELFYITYSGKDGREGELELLGLDVAHDLALLGSSEVIGKPIAMSPLPPRGAPIFAMGNPLDLGLSIAVGTNGGILNQTDDSRILFSGSLNPGMSGGPTFNELGEVIGINVATARNDISFIVPSRFLEDLISRAAAQAFTDEQDLKREVARQVLAYESNYIDQLLTRDWPDLDLRHFRLPGVISPTVRCWDNSAKLSAVARYRRYQIRCANKNHVYLDEDNKFVGKFIYEYYWLETDELNSIQFYNLYENLNKDQIETKLDRDIVSNFNCETWFVQVSSQEMKSNLCRREYVEYEGMSDILFTAALTGHKKPGIFHHADPDRCGLPVQPAADQAFSGARRMEALILEVNTRGLHRYYPIEQEVTSVGRALDNDIILSDPTVAPHHLKIIRYGDNSLELVNLAEVNPTRVDNRRCDSLVTDRLPLKLELGRIHGQLMPRDFAVAATKPLAGNGRRSHLFGHIYWAVILALLCLAVGALEFYFGSYNSFKLSDLFKYVLRETVLSIGAAVLALAIMERLLVNRWEVKQLVISVSLVYLLFFLTSIVADGLGYLFSASWPQSLFHFGWYLIIIPGAIALYLIHISHLKHSRSIVLAILIASPIAVPSLLQSPELQALLDDFSITAKYQNNLSTLNWHLQETISVNGFIEQAQTLDPGEFAD